MVNIQYDKPASVIPIIQALGRMSGVNNTPDYLMIDTLKIKKGSVVSIDDGKVVAVDGKPV